MVDSLTFEVSEPTLTIFLPKKPTTRTSVIIIPGGGYGVLLTKREGSDVARAFAAMGVTAFVLKYRIPSDRTMIDRAIGPLQDAQQAIKIVRQHAKEWKLDPQKIGVMGFSAGGHLASSPGTHFEKSLVPNEENTSLRPDFMLLVNPVISFSAEIGHTGSRDNLLGKSPSPENIALFSNELQVGPLTPISWLVHSSEDKVVPVANSIAFYTALRKYGIPAELHLYSKGEHGFLTAPAFVEWFGRCIYWMKQEKLME
ncbi:alpha/beta hydrolase [Mucilaginibacter humi]|uniref:alpha/beta hydrolase n=1 Tax=Mucilaginibacter humi TaxID=2732510 RepID=UPI001FE67702|nr:alpha/beta hydrolase [Mucilaginibacter humi]